MTTTDITIIHVSKADNWELSRDIRQEVFVEEQECPPEDEWDQYDCCSRHLVAIAAEDPAATARWRSTIYKGISVAKLERIAVREPFRGRGIGRAIVEALIEDARSAGFNSFMMHAQAHLCPFYESMGFTTVGDEFIEAGIPHRLMIKLAAAD